MRRFVPATVLVLLVLGAATMYAAAAWRDARLLTPEQIAELPRRLEGVPIQLEDPPYVGTRDVLEERIVELSGADYYAAVDYTGEDGSFVRLHVGAAGRTDAWFHEPTVCLPAHGWTTRDVKLVPLWAGLEGPQEDARIWRMTLEKGDERMLVYYWLQFGDRIVTSKRERRWVRFLDRLAGERDKPGQIVILYTALGTDVASSEARMEGIARALWPHLFSILEGDPDHGT